MGLNENTRATNLVDTFSSACTGPITPPGSHGVEFTWATGPRRLAPDPCEFGRSPAERMGRG